MKRAALPACRRLLRQRGAVAQISIILVPVMIAANLLVFEAINHQQVATRLHQSAAVSALLGAKEGPAANMPELDRAIDTLTQFNLQGMLRAGADEDGGDAAALDISSSNSRSEFSTRIDPAWQPLYTRLFDSSLAAAAYDQPAGAAGMQTVAASAARIFPKEEYSLVLDASASIEALTETVQEGLRGFSSRLLQDDSRDVWISLIEFSGHVNVGFEYKDALVSRESRRIEPEYRAVAQAFGYYSSDDFLHEKGPEGKRRSACVARKPLADVEDYLVTVAEPPADEADEFELLLVKGTQQRATHVQLLHSGVWTIGSHTDPPGKRQLQLVYDSREETLYSYRQWTQHELSIGRLRANIKAQQEARRSAVLNALLAQTRPEAALRDSAAIYQDMRLAIWRHARAHTRASKGRYKRTRRYEGTTESFINTYQDFLVKRVYNKERDRLYQQYAIPAPSQAQRKEERRQLDTLLATQEAAPAAGIDNLLAALAAQQEAAERAERRATQALEQVLERDARYQDLQARAATLNTYLDGAVGSHYDCGNPMLILSQDRQEIGAHIDAYAPVFTTGGDEGLAWGYRSLLPSWRSIWQDAETRSIPGNAPHDFGPGVNKTLIFFSDGNNTTGYGAGFTREQAARASAVLRGLCANIKASGIRIIPILLDSSAGAAELSRNYEDYYEHCHSDPEQRFILEDAEAVRDTLIALATRQFQARLE